MSSYKNLKYLLITNNSKLSDDQLRSKLVLKSTLLSFAAKFVTIIMGVITMPMVYNSLEKYQYGVYVTLTSIITWIDMFDFGIANGLRNKLTEAIADNNIDRAKKYISTSYALMAIIAISLMIIYVLFSRFINWQVILNADDLDREMLNSMAFWVLALFLLRFVASIIRNVYFAFQQSFMVDIAQMFSKLFYLIIVIALVATNGVTLFRVAVFQSAISAIIPIILTLHFFCFKQNVYSPSLRYIDFKVSGDILGLGWQFFVIQISLLIIHSGNNLLISQFVNPESVPAYSLSYQLFSYVMIAYTVIITPLWSAYTDAWHQGKINWIRQTMKRIKMIYFLFVVGCIIVVTFSPWIFRIWLGPNSDISILMCASVAAMVLLDMWIRIYDYFINGVGKIRIQLIINIIMASINIPLAFILSVLCNMGAIGVVLASIISYSISAIISPIQARLILNNKAKGIWNK